MGVNKDSVLLTTVVPIIGFLMAWLMYLSPWPAVAKMRRERNIGELNPLPYAFGMANGLTWVGYGFAARDKYVFLANCMGVILGLYYTMSCYGFASERVQKQQLAICLIVVTTVLVTGGVNVLAVLSRSSAILLWGIVSTIILAFYWCSPLATVARVFQTRSSASLTWPLCTANLMCGGLWTIYGFVVSQPFLWAPNGAGVLLSIFQLSLIAIFPRTLPVELSPDNKLEASAHADVRIKLTLSLEDKGGGGGPAMVRQWSEGHWSDVSQDSVKEKEIPKDPTNGVPAARKRRQLMSLSSASSLRQLLRGSSRPPYATDPRGDEELGNARS